VATQTSIPRPVVFITGASAGIGAATVLVFAAVGYDVVLAARRRDRLEKIAQAAKALHPAARLLPVECDVDSDAAVKAAFETVGNQFGRIDVLVNNAGYGVYGSVERTPIEVFRANMETNFFGVIRCTQAALPLLRNAAAENRGRWGAAVVMVSSVIGRRTIPGMSAYCSSKYALEALSETLRVELHDERISVSVVNPGMTQTEFVDAAKGERPANFISPKNAMAPDAVARVILSSVKRPRRNRYLTLAGKSVVAGQWLAPGIVDALMLRQSWRKAKM